MSPVAAATGAVSVDGLEGIVVARLQAGVIPTLEVGVIAEAFRFSAGIAQGQEDGRLGHSLGDLSLTDQFLVLGRKGFIETVVPVDPRLRSAHGAICKEESPHGGGEGSENVFQGRHRHLRGGGMIS